MYTNAKDLLERILIKGCWYVAGDYSTYQISFISDYSSTPNYVDTLYRPINGADRKDINEYRARMYSQILYFIFNPYYKTVVLEQDENKITLSKKEFMEFITIENWDIVIK